MIDTLSPLIVIPASVLMIVSGLLVLTASIGIVRLDNFLPRVHLQAIIYSVALWSLLLASLLLTFSLKDRTFLHEILIGLFIFITSPVSSILLVRSFVLREERAHQPGDTLPDSDSSAGTSETEEARIEADTVAQVEAQLKWDADQNPDADPDARAEAQADPDVEPTQDNGEPGLPGGATDNTRK